MSEERFRPAWWLPGPHAQTIGARVLRSARGVRFTRERVELPDGDFLDLDWLDRAGVSDAPDADAPLVLVLHGLEGCARSKYALEAYRSLRAAGLHAVGLNFRSCSGEPNRLPRLYHSGDTGDLSFILSLLKDRFPHRRVGALGFSLGGNVLLKFLGEGAPGGDRPVRAAASISVPFDLGAGADHLERGFRRVYLQYLMRRLKGKVRAKVNILDGRLDVPGVLRTQTFREFDEAATAVLHGFDGAEDYYRRSSCAQFLKSIRVPTLIIHAKDDPFVPSGVIPERISEANPRITTWFVERGGHVGFVSGQPWAPVFWAERSSARWLARRLGDEHPSAS